MISPWMKSPRYVTAAVRLFITLVRISGSDAKRSSQTMKAIKPAADTSNGTSVLHESQA